MKSLGVVSNSNTGINESIYAVKVAIFVTGVTNSRLLIIIGCQTWMINCTSLISNPLAATFVATNVMNLPDLNPLSVTYNEKDPSRDSNTNITLIRRKYDKYPRVHIQSDTNKVDSKQNYGTSKHIIIFMKKLHTSIEF